ncbi:MAG TPA: peroxidase [Acidimicrobiia bacterium]|jgi:uncharacterized peroxidase-related enzyme|nr:peroxidase [Acidimicrobiia bacterium]
MSFLKTVAEEEAEGDVANMFERDVERVGYLPNYSKTFSLHPAAYQAWRSLIASIAKPMDARRYEIATVAAARRLRSTYCSLAHGEILAEEHMEPSDVARLARDPEHPPLDVTEALIFRFASKVAEDAISVTEEDIVELRAAGLSDRDILDVALASAARCFFSKVLDATGTLADSAYNEMDPELRDALTVGRPIGN